MRLDLVRRVVAVTIALRALTNFGKPFNPDARLVVLGHLLGGAWRTIAAPLLGFVMLVYAAALWRGARSALPLAAAYAVWATLNVVLFPVFEPIPGGFGLSTYALAFGVPGIVVPWLAVWLVARSRA